MPEPADGVLDRATLDELFQSVERDPEFMAELIDTYAADAPTQVEALRDAVVAGDVDGLVRPAHTLKSASASLGALGLSELCRQLEASAKAGAGDGTAAAVDAIGAEVERVLVALEAAKRSYAE
jgi:HPt (histidine-containing phosphotransfer) domain-containing protein